jgi:hypothetical protein
VGAAITVDGERRWWAPVRGSDAPAARVGGLPGPSPPGSCPAPLASPSKCTGRNRDRNIFLNLVPLEFYPLDFPLTPPLRRRSVVDLQDFQAENALTFQNPRDRSALPPGLKLTIH